MNLWTECIDSWQIAYLGQGYSNSLGVTNDHTPQKSVIFLFEFIAKTITIFS